MAHPKLPDRVLTLNLHIGLVMEGTAETKSKQLKESTDLLRDTLGADLPLGLMTDHEQAQIKASTLAGLISAFCVHHKFKGGLDAATAVLAEHGKQLSARC